MQFEHIIQINDPSENNLPILTRTQLWKGLVLRAREPNRFLVGLDTYRILEDNDNYMKRCLELPGLTVNDEVWLTPEERIEYKITPTESTPGGTLEMQIEEPEPNALFVRFKYCALYLKDLDDTLPYDLFAQQAYLATDIETIAIIRNLSRN